MSDIKNITAVILAGGIGTRLQSVIMDRPKVLAKVGGMPFLNYVLRHLRLHGIAEVVLCTGHAASQVAEYCGDGASWGLKIRYSTENRPLGTGGAIALAKQTIGSNPFLVLNGDSLVGGELAGLVRYHEAKRALVSLMLVEVPDKSRFGSVSLTAAGAVLHFIEKGEGGIGLINAGVYLMDEVVLNSIKAGAKCSLEEDLFPHLIGQGLFGWVAPGPFIDIGTPESYAEAETVLADWFGDPAYQFRRPQP